MDDQQEKENSQAGDNHSGEEKSDVSGDAEETPSKNSITLGQQTPEFRLPTQHSSSSSSSDESDHEEHSYRTYTQTFQAWEDLKKRKLQQREYQNNEEESHGAEQPTKRYKPSAGVQEEGAGEESLEEDSAEVEEQQQEPRQGDVKITGKRKARSERSVYGERQGKRTKVIETRNINEVMMMNHKRTKKTPIVTVIEEGMTHIDVIREQQEILDSIVKHNQAVRNNDSWNQTSKTAAVKRPPNFARRPVDVLGVVKRNHHGATTGKRKSDTESDNECTIVKTVPAPKKRKGKEPTIKEQLKDMSAQQSDIASRIKSMEGMVHEIRDLLLTKCPHTKDAPAAASQHQDKEDDDDQDDNGGRRDSQDSVNTARRDNTSYANHTGRIEFNIHHPTLHISTRNHDNQGNEPVSNKS